MFVYEILSMPINRYFWVYVGVILLYNIQLTFNQDLANIRAILSKCILNIGQILYRNIYPILPKY